VHSSLKPPRLPDIKDAALYDPGAQRGQVKRSKTRWAYNGCGGEITDKEDKSVSDAKVEKPIELSDALKAFESISGPSGILDAMKATESMAGPGRDAMKVLKEQFELGGIRDAREAIESVAGPGRDAMKALEQHELGVIRDARKAIESVAGPGRDATKAFRSISGLGGISDELRRSLERTALLAGNVDRSLSNMALPAWYHEDIRLPPLTPLPAPEPNPVWQTNTHLSELTGTVTQLVDVARQQAELSQAIRTSADLALKYAIQSGEDAKAATLLARKGVRLTAIAITVAMLIAAVSIVVNRNLSNSTDVRLKEEIRLLQQLNDRLVEPNKGSHPASAR
jgi:hypothetical protein